MLLWGRVLDFNSTSPRFKEFQLCVLKKFFVISYPIVNTFSVNYSFVALIAWSAALLCNSRF